MRRAALVAWMGVAACGGRSGLYLVAHTDGGSVDTPGGSTSSGASVESTPRRAATSSGSETTTTAETGGSRGTSTTGAETSRGRPRDAGTDAATCPEEARPWLLFEVSGPTSTSLYAMRADGSGGHRVPLVHPAQEFASISADGEKLLYVAFDDDLDGGDSGTLFLEDLRARTATPVVTGEMLTFSALSADNRTVAYTVGFDVHVVDADGTNDRAVLVYNSYGYGSPYGHPVFVGASSTFLYGTGDSFGSVRADGSENVTLVTEDGEDAYLYPNPAISPDLSSVVAAVGCKDDDAGTWLRIYPYASLPGACELGERIAGTSGTSAAYSASADPAWGPSNLIAYNDGRDVYVVDPGGGGRRNMSAELTDGSTTAFDPVWAPGCAPIP